MFEYLRQEKITGRDRHVVFELIHGGQDYARAVVAEHANYVQVGFEPPLLTAPGREPHGRLRLRRADAPVRAAVRGLLPGLLRLRPEIKSVQQATTP